MAISVLIYAQKVSAENSNLEIDYSGKPGPLFQVTNFAPKNQISESLNVKNLSDSEQTFGINISEIMGNIPLADALRLKIDRSGTVLLNEKLASLKSDQETKIEKIPPKSDMVYNFTVIMENVGNAYQGLKIKTADFVVGFIEAGQVLGEKIDVKAGGVLTATGTDIRIALLYAFVFLSVVLIFRDERKIKILKKWWQGLWIN